MLESATEGTTLCAEFPRELLPLLRCSRDGGQLDVSAELRSGPVGIIEAGMRCRTCSAEYTVQEGIARLMIDTPLPEDEHEMAIRDREYSQIRPGHFVPPSHGWRSELNDRVEIPPHLDALAPLDRRRVLEFGCGDGRLTMLMAQLKAQILAVDFSINALRKLAWRLPSGLAPTSYRLPHGDEGVDLRPRVGLVQAHASHFYVAPRSFDRALSATPLDGRDQRMAMYRTISDSLNDEGVFVGGVEHDDLTRRLLGLPIARRYSRGGIFIEHFDKATLRREAAPFFMDLDIRPIRPRVPTVQRLPLAWAIGVSRMAAALPIVRELGEILLLRARRPIRPTVVEGVNRRGSKLVKGCFRWYVRRIGREPVWEGHERV